MKILIIGLGGIGQRHLRNIRAKFGDDVDIFAYRVRNLNQTITDDLAIRDINFIETNSVRVFTNIDEALSMMPDVAFICNPSSYHIASCITAAECGCDIFVEKPLSHSMENVSKLIGICDSKKLVNMVGFQLRFHPCFKFLKDIIKNDTIGSVLSVHAEVGAYLPNFHKYEDYRKLYASIQKLGGGVVLSQIHEIDYLIDLFGMPNAVAAIGGQLSDLEIDVEDMADVLMNIRYGKKNLPISLHMDYIQRSVSRSCKIVGEKGKVTMDLENLNVTIENLNGTKNIYNFDNFKRDQLFVSEINHFFECVGNRKETDIPIRDGAKSLKIALMIKDSIETGEFIHA